MLMTNSHNRPVTRRHELVLASTNFIFTRETFSSKPDNKEKSGPCRGVLLLPSYEHLSTASSPATASKRPLSGVKLRVRLKRHSNERGHHRYPGILSPQSAANLQRGGRGRRVDTLPWKELGQEELSKTPRLLHIQYLFM